MMKTIGRLVPLPPDPDLMCDECEHKVATWIGLTFQGTYYEPSEHVVLCDEHGGSDETT